MSTAIIISNEFGKTTVLEFIRRILFGFPKRKSTGINSYLPQKGGTHGGHLLCELSSGEIIRIHRTPGPNGGRVTVFGGNGSIQRQEPLSALLGHASSDLFHNIFAFSLDELQAFGSLQGEEVKNRIYGAGLGLGPTALTEAKSFFQNSCEEHFKIRGKNQKLHLLLEEMSGLQQSIQNVQIVQYCEVNLQVLIHHYLLIEQEYNNDQENDLEKELK
mgnify:CR=1 FL=1